MRKQVRGKRLGAQHSLAVLCMSFGVLALCAPPAMAVRVVNAAGPIDCIGGATSLHTTVQDAVDAALLAGTDADIGICPGFYSGPVTIDESGLEALDFVIFGSGTNRNAVTINGAGTSGPIISVVSAKSVRIQNLSVDGLSAMSGAKAVGIQYSLVNGVIEDVAVRNIRNPGGTIEGIGIEFNGQAAAAAEKTLRIVTTFVQNATGAAISVAGEGTNLEIVKSSTELPFPPFSGIPSLLSVGTDGGASVEDSVFGEINNCVLSDGFCRIFVSANQIDGDIDSNNNGNALEEADGICNADANKPTSITYKAMMVDGVNRVACTTANCSGGPSEHTDWVLQPNKNYQSPANSIGKTTANGVFVFDLMNSMGTTDGLAWTGLNSDWTASGNDCGNWTQTGVLGFVGDTDATTSDAINSQALPCIGSAEFYCVEQP